MKRSLLFLGRKFTTLGIDPEEVAVSYPGNQQIVIRPGTLQTGFLFSQPAGATREDMHRSIVSLMMSLVGTEMSEDDNRSGEHHQSVADSFVNPLDAGYSNETPHYHYDPAQAGQLLGEAGWQAGPDGVRRDALRADRRRRIAARRSRSLAPVAAAGLCGLAHLCLDRGADTRHRVTRPRRAARQ